MASNASFARCHLHSMSLRGLLCGQNPQTCLESHSSPELGSFLTPFENDRQDRGTRRGSASLARNSTLRLNKGVRSQAGRPRSNWFGPPGISSTAHIQAIKTDSRRSPRSEHPLSDADCLEGSVARSEIITDGPSRGVVSSGPILTPPLWTALLTTKPVATRSAIREKTPLGSQLCI